MCETLYNIENLLEAKTLKHLAGMHVKTTIFYQLISALDMGSSEQI